MATLKDVAPARAANLPLRPSDMVWQLNLDQVESVSGRILNKVTGPYAECGSSTQSFDTGNVLYSKLRPYLNKVVCPDDFGVATTELVPLRPDPARLDRGYLTHYLRSPRFVTWVSKEVAGAKMPRVSMKVFWEHEIPLPPIAEQKRIAAILDAADELRTKRRESLAQLDTLLQSTFLDLFGDPVTNPKGWKADRLESVTAKVTDGDHHTPKRETSGIKLLSARNVRDGSVDLTNTDYVGIKEYERMIRRCYPERNDILISCSGSIGRVARITFDEPIVLVRSAALVKPDHDAIDAVFLEHLLRTGSLHQKMLQASKASSQANLFQKPIKELPVILPPIDAQKRFAHFADSVAKWRDLLERQAVEFDHLFSSLQSRAFRGEL